MKRSKFLPVFAVVLCVPGVVARALHFLNGFDSRNGLPVTGNAWVWYCAVFFLLCAAAYAAMAAPLRAERKTPFEQLLGTQGVGFRMMAVISGLLLVLGGVGYLYLTMTTVEEDAAGWARHWSLPTRA